VEAPKSDLPSHIRVRIRHRGPEGETEQTGNGRRRRFRGGGVSRSATEKKKLYQNARERQCPGRDDDSGKLGGGKNDCRRLGGKGGGAAYDRGRRLYTVFDGFRLSSTGGVRESRDSQDSLGRIHTG